MKQYWLILISIHKSLFKIVIATVTGFVFFRATIWATFLHCH